MRQEGGRKLGVALVGLGRYSAGRLAPALSQTRSCALAGVVTGHPAKGEEWARKYQLDDESVYSYQDLERIADNPRIDIVYVVTPPSLHTELVVRAANAGKHVIVEKPMAASVADCDRMIAVCRAAKVKLAVGYRLHQDPHHLEMKRLADAAAWGPFMKISGEHSIFVEERSWRVDRKLAGGGPLMDVGIYLVQAACMAAGGISPVEVTAQELPKSRPELFQEVEEAIRWTMLFPNGAICEAVASFSGDANELRVESPRGWMHFTQQAFSSRDMRCETSRGPLRFPPMNQQAAQMDEFADSVLTGRDSCVPGELGRRDMQIISAVYEAAASRRTVTVAAELSGLDRQSRS